ncbi:MAG: hypothetical protein M1480_16875 [Bacteroidetes bacterium]|nr:hypothetical protein [Bacteroidota bacterium]
MKVIKQNTLAYESFHKSLPYLTKTVSAGGSQRFINLETKELVGERKYSKIFKQILEFEKRAKELQTVEQVFRQFEILLKCFIPVKEINLFSFDDKLKTFSSLTQNISERCRYFTNSIISKGIINEIINSGKPKIILDSIVHNIDGSKLFYLLFSIPDENKVTRVLSISTPKSDLGDDSMEVPLIHASLLIMLTRIDLLSKDQELKKVYNELQTYQSKLANDYKLSAIGELTSGIVEEILSPLQIITSTTEFLRGEDNYVEDEALDTIILQVKKVKSIIGNLIKFADTNDVKFKVQPLNINDLINEFYNLTISSLKNDNYECILDLEENLPSILIQPNYINQLMTNVFSLMRSSESVGGGIFIQSKYRDEKIVVKFLTTDFLEHLKNENIKLTKDANLRIIHNIMAKHEGELFFDSDKTKGTVITLSFPIKRKIGK